MRLVDTSAWIEALRPEGDPDVVGRIRTLLQAGEAAWCPIVRLELWNGARGEHERRVLRQMEKAVVSLDITPEVWSRAYCLARRARELGKTVPATDVLVVACARQHGVGLEHADRHMTLLLDMDPTPAG